MSEPSWMQVLPSVKLAVVAGVLAVVWFLERAFPFFSRRHRTLGHDGRNLALGLVNTLVVRVGFTWLTVLVAQTTTERHWGILGQVAWPFWVRMAGGILLFDLWMYLWHRVNHRVRFLWRFHRMHHTDPALSATSAFRFHTGEIIFSSILRLGVVAVIGLSAGQLILYEICLQPVILLHHSNIRFPAVLDRVLRLLIVTPRVHWVHHSRWRPETDSNYGSIFSWWDRIARSFRQRPDIRSIDYGLDGFDDHRSQSLAGMLLTPLRSRQSPPQPIA